MNPLVTIICISYNHAPFIGKALDSVLAQDYKNIQILVVDDNSSDDSVSQIKLTLKHNPEVVFIENRTNQGNCKSFNRALKLAEGKYIVDFALDDIMKPCMVSKMVQTFENLPAEFGVLYSDVEIIDEKDKVISQSSISDNTPNVSEIYKFLVKKSFINPVGMMVRKNVLHELGGYDENLAYEDFDFWIRSSRNYKYQFCPEVLFSKRISSGSHSSAFYSKNNHVMNLSTFRVCQKIAWLNRNNEEDEMLVSRINFEARFCFYMQQFQLVNNYRELLRGLGKRSLQLEVIWGLSLLRLPVHIFYKTYRRIVS
ncbi:MAG: glycosyltransferase family 2 protein [Cytophagaceae bacterium]